MTKILGKWLSLRITISRQLILRKRNTACFLLCGCKYGYIMKQKGDKMEKDSKAAWRVLEYSDIKKERDY